MFKFLKNDLLKILDVTQTERDTLFNHKIYSSIHDMNHLHIFMENHIFAVWDFMSILKTLQRDLTESTHLTKVKRLYAWKVNNEQHKRSIQINRPMQRACEKGNTK